MIAVPLKADALAVAGAAANQTDDAVKAAVDSAVAETAVVVAVSYTHLTLPTIYSV